MESIKEKHCLLNYKGKINHLYLSDQHLFYKTIENDNLTTRDIIADNIKNFDATFSADGCIYAFCCSVDKKMMLYQSNGDSWKAKTIYDYSKTNNLVDNIYILSFGNRIHLMYRLSDVNGQQAVFHHCWDGYKWINNSIVIPDRITLQDFCVIHDQQGRLHAMITGYAQRKWSIWYTYLNGDTWAQASPVYSCQERIYGLSMLVRDGLIHSVWFQREANTDNYMIMYIRRDDASWQNPILLSKCEDMVDDIAIFAENDILITQWKCGDSIWQSNTKNNKNQWGIAFLISSSCSVVKSKYIIIDENNAIHIAYIFVVKDQWHMLKGDEGFENERVDNDVNAVSASRTPQASGELENVSLLKKDDIENYMNSLHKQMALLVDLYSDIKAMLAHIQADIYNNRTASLRETQVKQRQINFEVNQLRQINEDIMKTSMHLQERNQLLERLNQTQEEKIVEYERVINELRVENEALKKELLDIKLKGKY